MIETAAAVAATNVVLTDIIPQMEKAATRATV